MYIIKGRHSCALKGIILGENPVESMPRKIGEKSWNTKFQIWCLAMKQVS